MIKEFINDDDDDDDVVKDEEAHLALTNPSAVLIHDLVPSSKCHDFTLDEISHTFYSVRPLGNNDNHKGRDGVFAEFELVLSAAASGYKCYRGTIAIYESKTPYGSRGSTNQKRMRKDSRDTKDKRDSGR
ncbi:hypothetical protein Tco_0714756 [Tanacetum coccineum]